MKLPEIVLDDRRFQDLVNEARLRINQTCPEWTEHNVSDPGITLIELFAFMTETLIYRVNRIPDKLHVALLQLLGIGLQQPTAARTEIRFRMSGPATEPLQISAIDTEVGTVRTAAEESIIFRPDEDFEIPAAEPVSYVVERDGTAKDVGIARGSAKPKGPDQLPFSTPPKIGDALYLGFDVPLGRLLMQIDVDCSQARGAGVDPEDPPLKWEVCTGDGPNDWEEAEVLIDRTGGFNYGSGTVELQLPPRTVIRALAGNRAHWIRCRLTEETRSGQPTIKGSAFTHPPEIYSITGAAIGAQLPSSHAAREPVESLGESDGTPGQSFAFRYSPLLEPAENETLEIRHPDASGWEVWERKESFVESGPNDRHYVLDLAGGELTLGPAIRTPDGGWRQYGAVPAKDAQLRFTGYRHGGGRKGNVRPNTLTTLKSGIPGVSEVSNPVPALGGVDAESLDSVRQRSALEFRTRYRAVTASDFEFLAVTSSPRVARAVCVPPEPGGVVKVHVLPRVAPGDRKLEYDELVPDEELMGEVAAYLDERRLIGVNVQLLPVKLRGISVVVNLQASDRADTARVEEEVAYALYTYLNPLVGGSPEGPGEGWAFGRALNQGELFGIVHSVDGVDFVKILRVYETDMKSGKQDAKPAGTHLPLESEELIASGTHIVKAEHREY